MKKLFTLALLAATSLATISAQEEAPTSNWTKKNIIGLNLSQTSLSNWSAGGENSVAGNVYLNATANYKKGRWSWDNGLVADYGQTYTSSTNWQKSVDKLNLNTKVGYALSKHWNSALLLDFLTQMDKGYKSAADRAADKNSYISRFMAPGYLTLSLGTDYKPNKNFSLLVSPATGKLTFVLDDKLSQAGAYGVKPGNRVLAELGASLVANYNTNITSDISLATKLTLFTAYNHNPGNIDILWDVMLNFKVNKYINANITTNLIYDDDIKSASGGPRIQFREMIGIGASYTF